MITIIHGEDTAKSRTYYADLKKKNPQAMTFDGEKIIVADLVQSLQGQGLFDETKYIFIEELLSKKKQSKDLEAIISYINNNQVDQSIYLWESKPLTKKQLQQFTNFQSQQFDIPKIIFSFLDNLKPGNGSKLIAQFHQILETEDAEFVFFMIIRHIRILLAIKEAGESTIEEVKRLAPWQKEKLHKQAQQYAKELLITLFQALYHIETGMKTGQLSVPLAHEIDFLLMNL